jgi:hypothetical protein
MPVFAEELYITPFRSLVVYRITGDSAARFEVLSVLLLSFKSSVMLLLVDC